MTDASLLDPFVGLLEEVSSPAIVRAVEEGGRYEEQWDKIVNSGFLDALVPEEEDGAGLTLQQIEPLIEALGRHLAPAPIADTMVARAILARAGTTPPHGPIVLATALGGTARRVPMALAASHALIDDGVELKLTALSPERLGATGIRGSLAADIAPCRPIEVAPRPNEGLRTVCAALRSAEIAGASEYLLSLSIRYANERVQFGKPIGKQQAIQQQLAVMAEKAVLIRMAAQIGCSCDLIPSAAAAAAAKSVSSAGAVEIAAIAHAIHGAIGISEEHDLQLYTRRLYEARMADGADSFWARALGEARLASAAGTSVEFIRDLYGVQQI
jgi:alkylation response protein AidB-like acyl-CoA dehydrogenase